MPGVACDANPESGLGTQIQAELGEGHVNIIEAKEVLLTETHLALVMEFAAGNSLTGYVADKWQHAQHTGLFLGEDEARYFFRVRRRTDEARRGCPCKFGLLRCHFPQGVISKCIKSGCVEGPQTTNISLKRLSAADLTAFAANVQNLGPWRCKCNACPVS